MRRSLIALGCLLALFALRICQADTQVPGRVAVAPADTAWVDSLAVPFPPSPEELRRYGIEKPQ